MDHRWRLKPSTIEVLVCLKDYVGDKTFSHCFGPPRVVVKEVKAKRGRKRKIVGGIVGLTGSLVENGEEGDEIDEGVEEPDKQPESGPINID